MICAILPFSSAVLRGIHFLLNLIDIQLEIFSSWLSINDLPYSPNMAQEVRQSLFSGMDYWNGLLLEWTTGMPFDLGGVGFSDYITI